MPTLSFTILRFAHLCSSLLGWFWTTLYLAYPNCTAPRIELERKPLRCPLLYFTSHLSANLCFASLLVSTLFSTIQILNRSVLRNRTIASSKDALIVQFCTIPCNTLLCYIPPRCLFCLLDSIPAIKSSVSSNAVAQARNLKNFFYVFFV